MGLELPEFLNSGSWFLFRKIFSDEVQLFIWKYVGFFVFLAWLLKSVGDPSLLRKKKSTFGFLKSKKGKFCSAFIAFFPVQWSNSKFNSRKGIFSRSSANLYFWTNKYKVKQMLMFQSHVLVEHQEKKMFCYQPK